MTAETLLPLFRARFPEFEAQMDAMLTMILTDAMAIFALSSSATLYLAAHLMALDIESELGSTGASVDGGDGEIVSDSAGGKAGSFKPMADKGRDTFFTTTPYGRRYITLRNACPCYRISVRIG